MLAREYKKHADCFADLLHYAFLCDEGIVMQKDGSLLASWYYQGPDLNSASAEELSQLNQYFSEVIKSFGTGWMLQTDVFRKESQEYILGHHFPDPISKLIDQERAKSYKLDGSHFENIQTLSLTYKPTTELESSFIGLFSKNKTNSSEINSLKYFKQSIQTFEDRISHYFRTSKMSSVEILTFISACIRPFSEINLQIPDVPIFLDSFLACDELTHGYFPKISDNYIACITINGFPLSTYPEILASINSLALCHRWNSRFIFVDNEHLSSEFEKYRRRWFSKRKNASQMLKESLKIDVNESEEFQNKDALNMAEDADDAIMELSSNLRTAGYYSTTIILYHREKAKLESKAREVVKEINRHGFIAAIERINSLESYLGSLPGNGTANLKKPILNNLNFSHLAPCTSVWAGLETNPSPYFEKNSPPLIYAKTEDCTPFRLNLHVSDVGHSLIIGPTGSGKSTLVGLIMAQFLKYKNAQVFCFDKDYSAYSLVKACGGMHYDLCAEKSPSFCPLSKIEDENELNWAHTWLETLCTLQGVKYNPEKRSLQLLALRTLSGSTLRSLTNLNFQDPELREAIKHYTILGGLSILDSENDSFENSNFQVFELSKLLSAGDKNAIPVLLYLFHAIERKLDGSPTLIVLEEAWLLLANSLFSKKIEDWLRTMRKKNAAVVFVTQSLSEIALSENKNLILESCPTKIFLPNPQANNTQVKEQYQKIGLSEEQSRLISKSVPKRDYYYSSSLGNRMFSLDLDATSLAFIGKADQESLSKIKIMEKQDNWQNKWIEQCS